MQNGQDFLMSPVTCGALNLRCCNWEWILRGYCPVRCPDQTALRANPQRWSQLCCSEPDQALLLQQHSSEEWDHVANKQQSQITRKTEVTVISCSLTPLSCFPEVSAKVGSMTLWQNGERHKYKLPHILKPKMLIVGAQAFEVSG